MLNDEKVINLYACLTVNDVPNSSLYVKSHSRVIELCKLFWIKILLETSFFVIINAVHQCLHTKQSHSLWQNTKSIVAPIGSDVCWSRVKSSTSLYLSGSLPLPFYIPVLIEALWVKIIVHKNLYLYRLRPVFSSSVSASSWTFSITFRLSIFPWAETFYILHNDPQITEEKIDLLVSYFASLQIRKG